MKFKKIEMEPMSFKDAMYLQELMERDEAKPVRIKTYNFKMSDGSDPKPDELCPSCGSSLTYVSGKFCPECGQRVDRENAAL